jgi:YHS domain-containing protein
MVKDVVCGMMVSEQHASEKGLTAQHQGTTYFFCSKPCRKKFNQNPQQFAGTAQPNQQKVKQ